MKYKIWGWGHIFSPLSLGSWKAERTDRKIWIGDKGNEAWMLETQQRASWILTQQGAEEGWGLHRTLEQVAQAGGH